MPDEKVDVTETDAKLITLEEGATLDAVVRALNALGATPRDVIAILQALKAAGALTAELVIICQPASHGQSDPLRGRRHAGVRRERGAQPVRARRRRPRSGPRSPSCRSSSRRC